MGSARSCEAGKGGERARRSLETTERKTHVAERFQELNCMILKRWRICTLEHHRHGIEREMLHRYPSIEPIYSGMALLHSRSPHCMLDGALWNIGNGVHSNGSPGASLLCLCTALMYVSHNEDGLYD